ncbi:MAG TPA: serine/threonine-protein kinase [Gemmatimonadaceae bacterium]|nr:serine/threonine-protein kinase [Gemmatimonadaceae bacterium]
MTDVSAAHLGELVGLQEALAGRYVVERELGRGGMGIVYLACDLALERPVAIKLLPPALAAQPELRARFLREIRTAASLSHPNIVPIHSVEEHQDLVFYAMGYVDGETLTEHVRRLGPLPASEVARVLQDAGWALAYAHGRGIVHRDVKPDNILIERATGRAFITDFGIARVANSTMTAVGASLGTPQFMSPEQAAGELVDARSDLYSLGVVAYFALTGATPFDGPTVQSILAMHLTKPAPPVSQARPGLPPKLAQAVDRCLAKEPEQRFASGDELVAAIQGAQGHTVPVAPQVRYFQRIASMSFVQIWSIALAMLVVADLRHDAAAVAAMMWAAIACLSFVQIWLRARSLLEQGFSYADVRALFAQDLREQQELDELAKRQPVRNTVSPSMWIPLVAGGGALVGVGVTLRKMTPHRSSAHNAGMLLIVLGVILAPLGILTSRMAASEESRLRRRINRLWMGPLGRGLFRLAAWRLGNAQRTAAPAAAAAGDSSIVALLSALPPVERKRLRDVRGVAAQLEKLLTALEQREHELDRSLSDAGATALAGGDGRAAAIADRREQLLVDLRIARQTASERRTAVVAAVEGLRVELLRLRSGLGSVERVVAEVEAARATIAAPHTPALAPLPVSTPA